MQVDSDFKLGTTSSTTARPGLLTSVKTAGHKGGGLDLPLRRDSKSQPQHNTCQSLRAHDAGFKLTGGAQQSRAPTLTGPGARRL